MRVGKWLSDHLILGIGLLVLLYMFVPIFVVIADVLQRARRPQQLRVQRVHLAQLDSTRASRSACATRWCCRIQIGLLATLVATILGTLMAFALVRHRFRGRSAANVFIFLPMASPEIVMGSSLLALFVAAGLRRPARLLDDPDRAHHVLPVASWW